VITLHHIQDIFANQMNKLVEASNYQAQIYGHIGLFSNMIYKNDKDNSWLKYDGKYTFSTQEMDEGTNS
jgi:hypothetical protein